MQCHPTPGEHRGNTAVGEGTDSPTAPVHKGTRTPTRLPQACSLAQVLFQCLLSGQVQVYSPLLSTVPSANYSNTPECGILTFIIDTTGPNVL